jgi:hypothetical protein
MAPHLGHVSNFCGVKGVPLEPGNSLFALDLGMDRPQSSNLGRQMKHVSNSGDSSDLGRDKTGIGFKHHRRDGSLAYSEL